MILRCLVLMWAATLFGCASFQGPGELNSAHEYVGPNPFESSSQWRSPASQASVNRSQPRGPFSLTWPLNMVKINQPFNPVKRRRPHLGVDFAGRKGTPIFAAHEGIVIYAGRAFRGFGKVVIVEYDDQWASLYAHLDKILVKQGDRIAQGQTVGQMGRTGRATGVHLHFELYFNKRPIDPIPLLNEAERLVDL